MVINHNSSENSWQEGELKNQIGIILLGRRTQKREEEKEIS